MYKRLTRSRIRLELASLAYLRLKYLNNYFAMYKRLECSCICVNLASPAFMGLVLI